MIDSRGSVLVKWPLLGGSRFWGSWLREQVEAVEDGALYASSTLEKASCTPPSTTS